MQIVFVLLPVFLDLPSGNLFVNDPLFNNFCWNSFPGHRVTVPRSIPGGFGFECNAVGRRKASPSVFMGNCPYEQLMRLGFLPTMVERISTIAACGRLVRPVWTQSALALVRRAVFVFLRPTITRR